MNRLQTKCIIASAGLHLLLVLIVLVGPAFVPSKPPAQDMPVLDFVPLKTVDALISGGGNPKGALPAPAPLPEPPPPQPAAPPPPPPPEPVATRTPPQPAIREPEPAEARDPDAFDLNSKPKHKPQINTQIVKRSATDTNDSRQRNEAREAAAEARRAMATAVSHAVAGIQSGLSGGTTIELKGPGGGGLPYANWQQAVKTVYDRAWVLPDGVTDTAATTTVSVTIARDGRVIESSITRSSGNATVDHSVQLALDRVRYAAPLPDDAKEDQRTVSINFNVKAKLLG